MIKHPKIFIGTLIALSLLTACTTPKPATNSAAPTPAPAPFTLTITKKNQYAQYEIRLSDRGVSEVVFQNDKGERSRTIEIPTPPEEVGRLYASINFLRTITPDSRTGGAYINTFTIVTPDGVPPFEYDDSHIRANHLLQGLNDEIEIISQIQLARALNTAQTAAQRANIETNPIIPASIYRDAIEELQEWTSARTLRYDTKIYEPEIKIEFEYPATNPGRTIKVMGIPNDISQLPEITPAIYLKAITHAWNELTTDFKIKTTPDRITVDFNPTAREFFGLVFPAP